MPADARGDGEGDEPADDDRPELRVHVVRYADGPDRATLSPRAVSAADHTTTWLSVDADALVSLADAR